MRFGLIHRILTDALAALGVLALVVSGQFGRDLSLAALAGLAIAVALREPWRQRAAQRHVDVGFTVLLIATQLGRAFFTRASVLDLIIEFAVGLQLIRVATRNGAAHDQQIIVLALLHLIAGTVVGGGLGYGLCFVGIMVVTPGALVLSHLRREVEGNYRQGARDRTGLPVDVPRILRSKRVVGKHFLAATCLLAIPILAFTSVLFLVFPRVGLSLLLLSRPRTERVIGFSDRVDLGQIGTLRSDPTIALRVRIPDLPSPPPQRRVMHLRGTALDHYDGRTWSQSLETSHQIAQAGELVSIRGANKEKERVWQVELEPFEPQVLFLAQSTHALRLERPSGITTGIGLSLVYGPEGELRYTAGGERGVRYDLHVATEGEPTFTRLRPLDRPRYLQVPLDLPARVTELATTWTDGAKNDFERARAIAERLRSDYAYDLGSPSGKATQPLVDFLFESKRGHCEFFSTALAVMLRTLEIPTRAVTGFVGGTYNKFGEYYAVRQGDAHSWVEVFIEGRGWLTFDPTPSASALPLSDVDGTLAVVRDFFEAVSQSWDHHVLGYDLGQQASLVEAMRPHTGPLARLVSGSRKRAIAIALGVTLAIVSAYFLRKRQRRGSTPREPKHAAAKDNELAARLYRSLDRAMSVAGIGRTGSQPPSRHARALAEAGHPYADEVSSLTERYLTARFGARPFSGAEQIDFEARVKRIRPLERARTRRGVRDSVRHLAAELGKRKANELSVTPAALSHRPSHWPPAPDVAPVASVHADEPGMLSVAQFDDAPDSFRGHPGPPPSAGDLG